MAKPVINLNMLERAVAAVSPSWGVSRMRDKAMLAMMGGYSGASKSRPALRNWSPSSGDATADISQDLPTLRARSRDLARNAPLGGGAINTMVSHVVGTGLTMQSRIDRDLLGISDEQAESWQAQAEREFRLWCESPDCDVTRTQDFYGLQALAFRSALESGDVFALTPQVDRPASPYRLALQLIEADRVCNPAFGADSASRVAGVEIDENGAPAGYHICSSHPGALMRKSMTWDYRPAFGANTGRRNVLHLFDRRRPGQVRGVPILAPVIEPLKQLSRYTEAELQAAVVSGMFAVFVKMDPEAFGTLFDESGASTYISGATKWDGSLDRAGYDGPGKAINLLPGEDVTSANPGRPNAAFDPFVQAIVRQVGVSLEIPFEVLIKHFTASYSAARAALLDAWRFFRGRRAWLASSFCQPVYELFLEEAISTGRLAAPGFFSDPLIRKAYAGAEWVGDGPGSIDPLKEAQAAEKRIELEISTRAAESILHDGIDWETKHRQRAKEERMRTAGGTGIPEPQPMTSEEDDDEGDDDEEESQARQSQRGRDFEALARR